VTSKVENLVFYKHEYEIPVLLAEGFAEKFFFFGFKHKVGRGCSGHCKRSAREKPAA
jgi:hypothetical protein